MLDHQTLQTQQTVWWIRILIAITAPAICIANKRPKGRKGQKGQRDKGHILVKLVQKTYFITFYYVLSLCPFCPFCPFHAIFVHVSQHHFPCLQAIFFCGAQPVAWSNRTDSVKVWQFENPLTLLCWSPGIVRDMGCCRYCTVKHRIYDAFSTISPNGLMSIHVSFTDFWVLQIWQ